MEKPVCKGCELGYSLEIAIFLLDEEKVKEGYCSNICYDKAHKNNAVSKSASVPGSAASPWPAKDVVLKLSDGEDRYW